MGKHQRDDAGGNDPEGAHQRRLVQRLTKQGVRIEFVKES